MKNSHYIIAIFFSLQISTGSRRPSPRFDGPGRAPRGPGGRVRRQDGLSHVGSAREEEVKGEQVEEEESLQRRKDAGSQPTVVVYDGQPIIPSRFVCLCVQEELIKVKGCLHAQKNQEVGIRLTCATTEDHVCVYIIIKIACRIKPTNDLEYLHNTHYTAMCTKKREVVEFSRPRAFSTL